MRRGGGGGEGLGVVFVLLWWSGSGSGGGRWWWKVFERRAVSVGWTLGVVVVAEPSSSSQCGLWRAKQKGVDAREIDGGAKREYRCSRRLNSLGLKSEEGAGNRIDDSRGFQIAIVSDGHIVVLVLWR